MKARGEYISGAPVVESFKVTFWVDTGNGGGFGTPGRYDGFSAASRAGRRWMARGPDHYFSIARWVPPFSDRRELHAPQGFGLTNTGYISWGVENWQAMRDELAGGHLDAPEYLAIGSMWALDSGGVGGGITSRGRSS